MGVTELASDAFSRTDLSLEEAVKTLIGLGVRIDDRFRLPASAVFETPVSLPKISITRSLEIGAYSYLGAGCELRSASIGRFCSIARRVVMSQSEHPLDLAITHPIAFNPTSTFADDPYFAAVTQRRPSPPSGDVTIGHDVWIGEGAFIRSGVTIGTGAVVAGRAVVVKDVAPYDIVGGVPARTLKRRFPDETVERLLASQWWRRDIRAFADKIGDVEAFLNALESEPATPLVVRTVTCNRVASNRFAVTVN